MPGLFDNVSSGGGGFLGGLFGALANSSPGNAEANLRLQQMQIQQRALQAQMQSMAGMKQFQNPDGSPNAALIIQAAQNPEMFKTIVGGNVSTDAGGNMYRLPFGGDSLQPLGRTVVKPEITNMQPGPGMSFPVTVTPGQPPQYAIPGQAPGSQPTTQFDQRFSGQGSPLGPVGQKLVDYGLKLDAQRKQQDTEIPAYEKQYAQIQDMGDKSAGLLNTINYAKALIANPNFYSGPLSQQKELWKQLAATTGWGDPKAAASMESAGSVMNYLILNQIKTMFAGTGRVMQQEINKLGGAVGGLSDTPAGLLQKLDYMSRGAQRGIDTAVRAQQYKGVNGRLDSGWDKANAEFLKANPLFSQAELSGVAGQTPGTYQVRGKPVTIKQISP